MRELKLSRASYDHFAPHLDCHHVQLLQSTVCNPEGKVGVDHPSPVHQVH